MKKTNTTYEKIYIGSGPCMMLDALNSSLKNEKILIIDKQEKLGGAWSSINLFNCKGLENAIHYLLRNEDGYKFLNKYFDIDLELCSKKFYAIKILKFRKIVSVNNWIGRLIYFINGGDQAEYLSFNTLINLFSRNYMIRNTKYPRKGIVPVINKIIEKLEESSIKYKLKEEVNSIKILNDKVCLETNKGKYLTKKLVVSHGFLPPKKFFNGNKKINISLKRNLRPSLHINSKTNKGFLKSNKYYNYSQVLFPKRSNIKYVHKISQFLENDNKNSSQIIVVCALKHDLKYSYKNCILIAKELESYGLIPKTKRSKNDFFWQEILIPSIDNKDLAYINHEANNKIITMNTECFNTSLGIYSRGWNFPNDFFRNI